MARYSAEHKAQTRTRLLQVARDLFRRRGLDGASIEQVMRAAGLTRGGFYAHFESKEALVREVLREDSGLVSKLSVAGDQEAMRELFAEYLDPAARDELVQCPLVSHPMDAVRSEDSQRRTLYSEQIARLAAGIERALPASEARETQDGVGEGGPGDGMGDDAWLMSMLLVGAATLMVSTQDPAGAQRISEIAQRELSEVIARREKA